MNPSTIQDRPNLSPDEIRRVVKKHIERLPEELRSTLGLHLNGESIERTRVDWLVRIDCDASQAFQNSHELHKVLSDVQRGVEEELQAFVTILLNH